jgi:hypothetical protein
MFALVTIIFVICFVFFVIINLILSTSTISDNRIVAFTNLLVSLATGWLAYNTYLSSKSSEKNFQLLQKQISTNEHSNKLKEAELSKNIFVRVLNQYLQPLMEEIETEIICIEGEKIVYGLNVYKNPINFPLNKLKNYFDHTTFPYPSILIHLDNKCSDLIELVTHRHTILKEIEFQYLHLNHILSKNEVIDTLINLIRKYETVYMDYIEFDHKSGREPIEYQRVEFIYHDSSRKVERETPEGKFYDDIYQGSIELDYFIEELKNYLLSDRVYSLDLTNPDNFSISCVYDNFANYQKDFSETQIFEKLNSNRGIFEIIHTKFAELLELDQQILFQSSLLKSKIALDYYISDEKIQN